ncbi:hypothetical protein FRC02_006461 [Tulasnella sp. 418]|nr:hypothetical protein FRC02_006461 [Tulasnella sp. 418]
MSPAISHPNGNAWPAGLDERWKKDHTEKFASAGGFYTDKAKIRADEGSYEYEKYMPTYLDVKWEPLGPVAFEDKGRKADPNKRSLLQAATEVEHLTPLIGTELSGIDLRSLTEQQKNDLALLVAERGVVVLRNQSISVEELVKLSHYYGPAYKHPFAGTVKGIEEVNVVYGDSKMQTDWKEYGKKGTWHNDASYENQPPGIAILKMITVSQYGVDTVWGSCTGLYSSLSPPLQMYLEKLEAIHSGEIQAYAARSTGRPIRRTAVDPAHPLVRVHPVTGWKSIFADGAFTTRIPGIPKSESDAVLSFLAEELANNPDLQVRFRCKKNDVVLWDNRVVNHTALGNGNSHKRHGLLVMHQAESPLSVTEYETTFSKPAEDRKGRLEVDTT